MRREPGELDTDWLGGMKKQQKGRQRFKLIDKLREDLEEENNIKLLRITRDRESGSPWPLMQ